MTMTDLLIREFEHETQTTRRHLERLPGEQLDWRPHQKSFTAGGLASHIVDCVGWANSILTMDELDIDPATYTPYRAASVADVLETFDDRVANCTQVLARVADADMMQPWRLKMMGHVRFERPRAAVFRDFTLSHLIHHRGQLSVYLRLLDVAVPGSYGPTADERA